ncbi:mediator of RNA polymerase II transcription subunit 1.1-like isoform X2 [Penaeus japonicus]|nr:mediator of RNA polymerase II transcription subunit 1.1-like isoform X2 [Penaeus japonicus]XP_042875859.1 mediator of RNA polymerase II transcription subunit 1.1-like isoform X2 [Penaeus japonicus]
MVGLWLAWSVVSIGMQLLWTCITLPYTPSVRGFASVFQLAWGIHYFIVIKTHFTRMSLTFTPPEEPMKLVPPNSPARKHRLHKRRIDQSSQPPIRTLLGAAIKLQGEVLKRQKENEVIEILAAGDEDEESEVEVLTVRRTSGGRGGGRRVNEGGGGGGVEEEMFELQPIDPRPTETERENRTREEDVDDERREDGSPRPSGDGPMRRSDEEEFETDGGKEGRKKIKKNKKRKKDKRERVNKDEKREENESKERKNRTRRDREERKTESSKEQDEIRHEDTNIAEGKTRRKKKHKQKKEEDSEKRKKRRKGEVNGRDTLAESTGSEDARGLRAEKQGHVTVDIEEPKDIPSDKSESRGPSRRGSGRLRLRLDSLDTAAVRIRRSSEGNAGGKAKRICESNAGVRTRRSSEGSVGVSSRRSSEGSVGVRTRRSSEGSVGVRTRRSSEGSVGVRPRRSSEDSAGVCLEPQGPPSPISPSHANVMVHWRLEMPQEEDSKTSSGASSPSSPPSFPKPQRSPGDDSVGLGARRRPSLPSRDAGKLGGTAMSLAEEEEGKREKYRIVQVQRKSHAAPRKPQATSCSRRISYKLAVGSPDAEETEIV